MVRPVSGLQTSEVEMTEQECLLQVERCIASYVLVANDFETKINGV